MSRVAVLLLSLALAGAAVAAEPAPATQAEMNHLLTYLGNSGCDFQRNGAWYDSREARAHLQRKQKYLLDRGMIATTEDFIAKAATQSSMSGKDYQVRCRPSAPVPSKAWLTAELARYREAHLSPAG